MWPDYIAIPLLHGGFKAVYCIARVSSFRADFFSRLVGGGDVDSLLILCSPVLVLVAASRDGIRYVVLYFWQGYITLVFRFLVKTFFWPSY